MDNIVEGSETMNIQKFTQKSIEEMQQELKKCEDIMADADDKMQNLANVSGIVQPIE